MGTTRRCVRGTGIAHWPRRLPVGSSLLLRLLRTGFWLPLWLSFLLATPCGPAAAQLPEAVEGRLLDHESSRPIANATVALQATDGAASPFAGPAAPTEAAVLTDASGRFRIPGVPAGRYRIQVRHLAYGVHRESVSIEGRGLATIEVRLTPTFIQLSTVVAEGEREREMSGRDSPASGNVVARDEIDRASLAGENLGDLLARRVVGISDQARQRGGRADLCRISDRGWRGSTLSAPARIHRWGRGPRPAGSLRELHRVRPGVGSSHPAVPGRCKVWAGIRGGA